jgi:hypothetical protein
MGKDVNLRPITEGGLPRGRKPKKRRKSDRPLLPKKEKIRQEKFLFLYPTLPQIGEAGAESA